MFHVCVPRCIMFIQCLSTIVSVFQGVHRSSGHCCSDMFCRVRGPSCLWPIACVPWCLQLIVSVVCHVCVSWCLQLIVSVVCHVYVSWCLQLIVSVVCHVYVSWCLQLIVSVVCHVYVSWCLQSILLIQIHSLCCCVVSLRSAMTMFHCVCVLNCVHVPLSLRSKVSTIHSV